MTKRFVGKWLAIGLAVAATVAMPISASANGWGRGGYGGGYYHGGYGYHGGGYYNNGCCYNNHPIATAAAITATAVVTAAVVGSIVHSVPPSCSSVIVNGLAYQQCGSTWYQPQFAGSTTTYIVVNAPR